MATFSLRGRSPFPRAAPRPGATKNYFHLRPSSSPSRRVHGGADVRVERHEQVPRGDGILGHDGDVLDPPVDRRGHRRLHLHRGEHRDGAASLDVLTLLHENLHHLARHRRADGSHVRRIALLPARDPELLGLARVGAIGGLDDARDPVHLEENLAVSVGKQLTNRLQLDARADTRAKLNLALLVDVQTDEERLRGQPGERPVEVNLAHVVVKHGRVNRRAERIAPRDVPPGVLLAHR